MILFLQNSIIKQDKVAEVKKNNPYKLEPYMMLESSSKELQSIAIASNNEGKKNKSLFLD